MRGKTARAIRQVVRAKYPQLEEADKVQYKAYYRKVKRMFKSLPASEKKLLLAVKN
jgi:hypothetical protein